jgi:hypothetical protein
LTGANRHAHFPNYWVVACQIDGKNFNSALHWARTTLSLPPDQLNDSIRGAAFYQIGTIQFYSYMFGGNFTSALDTLKIALGYLRQNSPVTFINA